MPLITIKPPRRLSKGAQSPADPSSPTGDGRDEGRDQSPEAPPASPLTPILRAANRAANLATINPGPEDHRPSDESQQTAEPLPAHARHDRNLLPLGQLVDLPPPQPFAGVDSTDAIALRAAISSLQFQRAIAQNDLRTLEHIKGQATARPEDFRQHVLQTTTRPTPKSNKPKWMLSPDHDISDGEMDGHASAGAETENPEVPTAPDRGFLDKDEIANSQQTPPVVGSLHLNAPTSQPQHNHRSHVTFPAMPEPQNVVRCPPIEWAKYHVLGESLDKLHMEQQVRPGVGGNQGRESIVAGPYNPFVDRLSSEESSTQERFSETRKDSGASAIDQATQRRSSKAHLPTN